MTAKNYQKAISIANEQNGIKARSVTSAMNGYPTPEIGAFIHGFQTMPELEQFIIENGGEPYIAHWRDDYNFVDSFGWIETDYPEMSNILKMDAETYGINVPLEYLAR